MVVGVLVCFFFFLLLTYL